MAEHTVTIKVGIDWAGLAADFRAAADALDKLAAGDVKAVPPSRMAVARDLFNVSADSFELGYGQGRSAIWHALKLAIEHGDWDRPQYEYEYDPRSHITTAVHRYVKEPSIPAFLAAMKSIYRTATREQ